MPGLSPLFIASVSLFGIIILALLVLIIVILVLAFWPNPKDAIPLPGGVGFPNVYPIIGEPINAGSNTPSCWDMVTNDKNEKQYANKLLPCKSDSDCITCEHGSCQEASAEVRQVQQRMFANDAARYCLPNLKQCLPDGGCDFSKFHACKQDSDCDLCNDTLGSAIQMKCVAVAKDEDVSINSHTCKADADRSICLPRPAYCDPANGIPTWVDDGVTQKWECKCRYPSVFGGADCSTLIACDNHLALPQTQKAQKLLINVGPAEEIGKEWASDSLVPPAELRCSKDWQQACSGDQPCGDKGECVPTTVCQCDGINAFSGSTFKNPGVETNEPALLNSCVNDTCFSTMQRAGRFDAALNSCICSGESRLLWGINQTTGAYEYKNACTDRKIGNVVLKGDTTTCFDPGVPANSQPERTGLVNMKLAETEIPVCGLDPCMGISGDRRYPASWEVGHGHWNPATNACECDTASGFYNLDITKYNENKSAADQIANNSLGHMCYDPCPPKLSQSLCQLNGKCVFDPTKTFAYRCECGRGFKPTADGSACESCRETGPDSGSQTCEELNCCVKCYTCIGVNGPFKTCDRKGKFGCH